MQPILHGKTTQRNKQKTKVLFNTKTLYILYFVSFMTNIFTPISFNINKGNFFAILFYFHKSNILATMLSKISASSIKKIKINLG